MQRGWPMPNVREIAEEIVTREGGFVNDPDDPDLGSGGGRGRDRLQTAYRAPETAVEKALALLWEKTLGIQPIGIDDDFIELGGDSIEAIQVQHAIHRDFDLRVKNTEFLAEPTIAALAALIAARAEGDAATRPA